MVTDARNPIRDSLRVVRFPFEACSCLDLASGVLTMYRKVKPKTRRCYLSRMMPCSRIVDRETSVLKAVRRTSTDTSRWPVYESGLQLQHGYLRVVILPENRRSADEGTKRHFGFCIDESFEALFILDKRCFIDLA